MRKFILKIFLLGIIVLTITSVLFHLSDQQAEKLWGPNTKNQIEKSFKNALSSKARCWLLGNSRIYRMNPDVIENRLWYNFAHDNDSYNQMYYKLQYLLENGCKVDTLVIGTDYFQFAVFSDTRNYVYDDLLGKDYIKDYNRFFLKENLNNFKRALITKQTAFGRNVLEICKRLAGGGRNNDVPYLRSNGSYYNNEGKAKENDATQRNKERKHIQIQYFEMILSVCRSNDIEAYVLMMPVRDNELINYDDSFIIGFNKFINATLSKYGYSGRFVDLSNHPDFKDYRKYTDITHLNSESANEFTKCFYTELKNY